MLKKQIELVTMKFLGKMKNKIYSKLFEFVDPKTWVKYGRDIESSFYKEYKLKFTLGELGWIYKIYPYSRYSNDSYDSSTCYSGVITLNKSGKILVSTAIFLVGFIILYFLLGVKSYYVYILVGMLSIFFSFFIISVWNWKIYKALRKAQYHINNAIKIKTEEDEEKLNQQINNIVNTTIAKNPKLARKTKLEKLKKKIF